MVRIHPHLRRKIEGHGEPGSALLEQVPVATVALFGGTKAGILAHGPQTPPVHIGINAPRVGKFARLTQFAHDRENTLIYEREILRARRNEEMPYAAMMVMNATVRISVKMSLAEASFPASSSRMVRMPEGIGQAANARNKNPMISCQSVRAGRNT